MTCGIAGYESVLSAWSSDGGQGLNVGGGIVCVLVLADIIYLF